MMETFVGPSFLQYCSLKANHIHPFAFNEDANASYMKRYIAVFKRTKVKVPANIYNYYLKNGLLDRTHTMGTISHYLRLQFQMIWSDLILIFLGEFYPPEKWEPHIRKTGTWLPVFFRGGNLNAWTIIRAMVPPLENWGTGQQVNKPD